MHQVHFIIPDPASFPSGGNVYNARLIEAVIKAGAHVSHDVFRPEWTLASPDTVYILDSLYFEHITDPEAQIPSKCIGLVHHLHSLFPWSASYFNEKEKPILAQMSGFLVSSRFTKQYLSSRGFEARNITLIEPAPSMQGGTRRIPDSKVNALMLGSCIPRKGLLPFLEALALADIPPYYSLTIAGSLKADPTYARKCATIVLNDLKLKKCVRFLGVQDEMTVRNLYDKSNLFLSSSFMETFGMAIQDAVVCGMPVLAMEGGYAAEHVSPGINGMRCKTPEQLVRAFEHCVMDSDYFRTLQEGAIDLIPQYHTWDQGADTLIEEWLREK